MSRAKLRPVPPLPDDELYWRRLMNFLFIHEQDSLFLWLKLVRKAVEEAEREKGRAA